MKRVYNCVLIILALVAAARAHSATYYPSGNAWLGGSEWERRLEASFHAGLSSLDTHSTFSVPTGLGDRKGSLGIAFEFRWGPWAGLNFSYQRTLRTLTTPPAGRSSLVASSEFYTTFPIYISWAEGNYVAPFVGFEYEALGANTGASAGGSLWPTRHSGFPFGVKLRFELLGLAFLIEGSLELLEALSVEGGAPTNPASGRFSVQSEWTFSNSDKILSFLALRYSAKFKSWIESGVTAQSLDERGLFLITGTRF